MIIIGKIPAIFIVPFRLHQSHYVSVAMRFNVDHIQDAAIANGIVWSYECILGRCPKLKLCNIFYMHIWIFAMCLFGTRLAIFAFRLRVTWDDISIRAGTDVYIFASPSCRTSRGQWDMNTCGMVMMLFIGKNWSTPIHKCDYISIYFFSIRIGKIAVPVFFWRTVILWSVIRKSHFRD